MTEVAKAVNSELEYEQINENFRSLADVRFKLLALVPTLGGAAVFILAHLGLEAGKPSPSSYSELLVVLLVSTFGLLATLGITLYDQRNSELYNALIHRAKYLERQFGWVGAPGALRTLGPGGQFSERPKGYRRIIFKAAHDRALALIYGPLLGAWLFPISYAGGRLSGMNHECVQIGSAALAAIAAAGCAIWLVELDTRDRDLYNVAAKRDGLSDTS